MAVKVIMPAGRPSRLTAAMREWGVDYAESLIEFQESNDQVASGASLNYDVKITKQIEEPQAIMEIYAVDYFQYLVTGRGPGKFPPLSAIYEWLFVKPVTPDRGTSLQQLAYLIARKIATVGDRIFRGERQGLPVLNLLNDAFDKTKDDIALAAALDASDLLPGKR